MSIIRFATESSILNKFFKSNKSPNTPPSVILFDNLSYKFQMIILMILVILVLCVLRASASPQISHPFLFDLLILYTLEFNLYSAFS